MEPRGVTASYDQETDRYTLRVCSQSAGALRDKGLDVRRMHSVPFGVRWEDDLAALLEDSSSFVGLDVGANVGQTATKLARRFPQAEIHSFEPAAETFARLVENTRHLNVHCVHTALGDEPGQGSLAKAGTGQASLHAAGGQR